MPASLPFVVATVSGGPMEDDKVKLQHYIGVSSCTRVSQAPATSASPCPLPPQPHPASLTCLEAEDLLLLAAGIESHPGPLTCPLCCKYMTEVKANLVRHKKFNCPMRHQQQDSQQARRASKRVQPEEVRATPLVPSFATWPSAGCLFLSFFLSPRCDMAEEEEEATGLAQCWTVHT